MANTESTRPLLEWVLKRFPDTPKKRAKQWITAGRVSIDGRVMSRPEKHLPDPGARLKLLDRHATAKVFDATIPIHSQLTILHLDSAVAIVNKGAGLLSLPVKNSRTSALGILRDFLKGNIGGRISRSAAPSAGVSDAGRGTKAASLPPAYRNLSPLPVHRLDQYTSGLLCFALNPKARADLIEQFRSHSAERQYIAFADGRPKDKRGTWRHRMRLSADGKRQEIVEKTDSSSGGAGHGRPSAERDRDVASARSAAVEAVTHYEILEEFEISVGRVITKLRFRLETGCRHQIRIQAAREKTPIIGDRTYHPLYRAAARGAASRRTPPIVFARQALHAELLAITHPDRPKEKMSWTAPMPEDLRRLESELRNCLHPGPNIR